MDVKSLNWLIFIRSVTHEKARSNIERALFGRDRGVGRL